MPGLAQPGGGLCPAEGLLDALSDDLADLVAGMAGRASVNGGALDLSRDVRGDVEGAKLSDEVLGVVALVGPQRDAARSIGAGFEWRAAMRSAWPSATVRQASTTNPLRFSIRAWPMKPSFASRPAPLR